VQRRHLSAGELAEIASRIEIDKLEMPIGRQDQYAAAFGGLNVIRFESDRVEVEPLDLRGQIERALERRTMLFFTGVARSASAILKDQQAATAHQERDTIRSLHRIKGMAQTTIEILRAGELTAFGELLHESWEAKKRLASGISNGQIDDWYATARANGAIGGKITGAGGGGFLMLYCEESHQEAVTTALELKGLTRMDFHFEHSGAVILMDALPRVQGLGAGERALSYRG